MILYNFKNLLPKNENITEYHAMLRVRTSKLKKNFFCVWWVIFIMCVLYIMEWLTWKSDKIL